MRLRIKTQQAGFSLAEAMVVVGILGLIGTLTFGGFGRSVRTREQAETMSTHYHMVRQAMLRMTRELQSAFVSQHRDCDDPRSDTAFVGRRASGGSRLDFTAFSHFKIQADGNESDQEEISYYIGRNPEEGAEGTVLIRRNQRRIDEEPGEGGLEQVLCENATELTFEFYDPKEDRWEEEWDSKGRDYRDRLPMFVKVTLKVKGPSGEEETFTTKTRIFLQRSLEVFGSGFVKCVD